MLFWYFKYHSICNCSYHYWAQRACNGYWWDYLKIMGVLTVQPAVGPASCITTIAVSINWWDLHNVYCHWHDDIWGAGMRTTNGKGPGESYSVSVRLPSSRFISNTIRQWRISASIMTMHCLGSLMAVWQLLTERWVTTKIVPDFWY